MHYMLREHFVPSPVLPDMERRAWRELIICPRSPPSMVNDTHCSPSGKWENRDLSLISFVA